jgi:hypothetical protein
MKTGPNGKDKQDGPDENSRPKVDPVMRSISKEEKRKEASRPLYLTRYE